MLIDPTPQSGQHDSCNFAIQACTSKRSGLLKKSILVGADST